MLTMYSVSSSGAARISIIGPQSRVRKRFRAWGTEASGLEIPMVLHNPDPFTMNPDHVSTDDLERYSQRMLENRKSREIDQHVKNCQYCQDRLVAIEHFLSSRTRRSTPISR